MHSRIRALLGALALTVPCVAQADDAVFEGLPSITVQWTAPGDDGHRGRALQYELRYSILPINDGTFGFTTVVRDLPDPGPPGTTERFSFRVPYMPSMGYYFAIRTLDDAGNWSEMSNVAYLRPETLQRIMEQERATPALATVTEPLTLSFASPAPNPARGSTRFAFALPQAADIRVEVFDPAGRRVRTLANGPHAAGRDALVWDLRTDSGIQAAPGLYLVRAQLAGQVWNRRVTVVQ